MRLVSFDVGGQVRPGLRVGDRVIDVRLARPDLPRTVLALLQRWSHVQPTLRELARTAETRVQRAVEDVRLVAPLRPERIFGTGANYVSHQREMDVTAPPDPSCFLKLPGTVADPGAALNLRADQTHVDYEGEIAVVLGGEARDLAPSGAAAVIAGLMLSNDISARDVPMSQLVLAKGAPGFCPLGPELVTLDELALDALSFVVSVNGEVRQRAHTREMSHTFGDIVSSFSRAAPLHAGDVILTGTPAGVGVGMVPPRFLRDGDVVVVESPELGSLRTPVTQAPAR